MPQMVENKPHRKHLSGKLDIETTDDGIRAVFASLAIEKNRRATPFVEQARYLKIAASQAKSRSDLLKIEAIEPALLTAVSAPAGTAFVEELVFRFLLTRGDTLGGSMRNIGGVMAGRKLTRATIANLSLAKTPYQWLHSDSKEWITGKEEDADIELRGVST